VHGRGRFLGELSQLTGEGSYYSAVARDAGQVLAVPAGRLRDLVTHDPALGDLVLRAYLLRRSILIGLGVGLRIVGSRYSPDTRRVREFAARNRLPSRWLDLENDPSAPGCAAPAGCCAGRRHPGQAFGGISIALARTFKLIDAERNAVHTEEWERTFALFRLLI
jgi:hypothetical protein